MSGINPDEVAAVAAAEPFTLHLGDCIEVMRRLADNSVDSIVCDPPYELTSARPGGRSLATEGKVMKGFMGLTWDGSGIAYSVEMWREALRVLKPGGHLLAFSGTRTSHRMVCAIEDAGFEIRDSVIWAYGSGFPKSQNVSKAIDKQAGAEREVISEGKAVRRMIPGADQDATGSWIKDNGREYVPTVTAASTPEAQQWEGWGSALKPAHEPCCMARKPLAKGMTIAANVLAHGVGGLNIDGCRVEPTGESRERAGEESQQRRYTEAGGTDFAATPGVRGGDPAGRWPANIIHDGSAEVLALFPDSTSGTMKAGTRRAAQDEPGSVCYGTYGGNATTAEIVGSTGSAARFFYCAKASRADRNEGVGASSTPAVATEATMRERENADWPARNGNHHPTVKPTDLMAYLVRLVTPPGGLVLDPFMGSGSTGKACMREGFRFVGIDMTAEYLPIARARIEHELAKVRDRAALAATPVPQLDLFVQEAAC